LAGRKTPDPRWPNQARLAVQFVINYEEEAVRTAFCTVMSSLSLSEVIEQSRLLECGT